MKSSSGKLVESHEPRHKDFHQINPEQFFNKFPHTHPLTKRAFAHPSSLRAERQDTSQLYTAQMKGELLPAVKGAKLRISNKDYELFKVEVFH